MLPPSCFECKEEPGESGNQRRQIVRGPDYSGYPGGNLLVPQFDCRHHNLAEYVNCCDWQDVEAGDTKQGHSDQRAALYLRPALLREKAQITRDESDEAQADPEGTGNDAKTGTDGRSAEPFD